MISGKDRALEVSNFLIAKTLKPIQRRERRNCFQVRPVAPYRNDDLLPFMQLMSKDALKRNPLIRFDLAKFAYYRVHEVHYMRFRAGMLTLALPLSRRASTPRRSSHRGR